MFDSSEVARLCDLVENELDRLDRRTAKSGDTTKRLWAELDYKRILQRLDLGRFRDWEAEAARRRRRSGSSPTTTDVPAHPLGEAP